MRDGRTTEFIDSHPDHKAKQSGGGSVKNSVIPIFTNEAGDGFAKDSTS